jgi:hypothetical protein
MLIYKAVLCSHPDCVGKSAIIIPTPDDRDVYEMPDTNSNMKQLIAQKDIAVYCHHDY